MPKHDLRIDWATHQAAKYACENWHYSKSVPVPPLVKVGVWESDEFIGVILFSRGATPTLLNPFGLSQTEGCELTRVALNKHKSPVSRIVRLAIAFLKKKSPGLRLIVSFADPSEGHYGGIYQAGNWIYAGQSSPSTEFIGPDGKRIHARMVKKKGWTTVQGVKRKVLTPSQCVPIKKPGKHRYLMPLDNAMMAVIQPLSRPYPKREKQAMGGDQPSQRRGSADPHAPLSEAAE